MPILLKLYRCFCHDLKICMWFGYYPEIIFCHFFCNLNLVIFKCFYYQSEKIVGTLCAQLHSCFGHGLKICMWFGYNPQIINNNGGGHKFSEFACFIYFLVAVLDRFYCMVQMNSVETISMDITFKISCIFRLLWTTMGGQPTFAQRHKWLGKSVD